LSNSSESVRPAIVPRLQSVWMSRRMPWAAPLSIRCSFDGVTSGCPIRDSVWDRSARSAIGRDREIVRVPVLPLAQPQAAAGAGPQEVECLLARWLQPCERGRHPCASVGSTEAASAGIFAARCPGYASHHRLRTDYALRIGIEPPVTAR